ncbi:MAG TPA: DUF1573 domain-containing protein [Anaerolineales bacterium]|nr:DUF1573 domain-containing protein [Anaerolineales bacterium]
MKTKILFWLLPAILFAGCAAGRPEIALETEKLVLGEVVNGEVVARDVTVYNRGASPLSVEALVTTCGCTSATLEPMTIPPGGSGVLHIEFDSGAHGPDLIGELLRQVIIVSDDPERPEVVLNIEANVLPRIPR